MTGQYVLAQEWAFWELVSGMSCTLFKTLVFILFVLSSSWPKSLLLKNNNFTLPYDIFYFVSACWFSPVQSAVSLHRSDTYSCIFWTLGAFIFTRLAPCGLFRDHGAIIFFAGPFGRTNIFPVIKFPII